MNEKTVKALRSEMRARGIDPTEADYAPELKGKRTYPKIQLPMVAGITWCTVPLVWGMYTLTSVPTTGRALYKKAKKLLDKGTSNMVHSEPYVRTNEGKGDPLTE